MVIVVVSALLLRLCLPAPKFSGGGEQILVDDMMSSRLFVGAPVRERSHLIKIRREDKRKWA